MNVGQLTAWIELNTKGFIAGLAKAKAGFAGFKKDLDKSSKDIKALGDGLSSLGKASSLFGLAGSAVALTAAVRPAVGALWLLPAAMSAGVGVALTLKAGLMGFGDALKQIGKGDAAKFADAIKNMAPAGKAFAQALWDMNTKLTAVRQSVQQKLFDGLAGELTTLGNQYLPIAEKGMGLVATALNGMGKAAADAMKSPFMQGVAAQVFATTASSVSAFTPIVGSLVTALGQVISVGLPFIAQFAQWAAGSLAAKAGFLGTAAGATYLHDKIVAGIAVLQQLGRIGANILTGFNNALNASGAAGTSLLGTIEALTGKFAAWSATADGQARLNALMSAAVAIFQSLAVILPIFAGALTSIATVFASLPAPVQSVVAAFLSWGLIVGRITTMFAPLFGLLGKIGPAVVGAAGRWGLLGTAARVAATASGASTGSILGAVGSMAAGVASRVGVAALGFLRFLGPIGLIISTVITLAILIVQNWDTIKSATITAWNAIGTAVSTAITAVVTFVTGLPARIGAALSALGTTIATLASTAWNGLLTACRTAVMAVVNFVIGLPAQIGYALGFLAGMIFTAATTAWNFLWTTLPTAIAAVMTWIATLPAQAGAALSALASTVSTNASAAWQWLVTHATTFGNAALAFVQAIPGRVGAFLSALPGIVGTAASTAFTAFLTAVTTGANNALTFIGTIPSKVQAFFSGAASWLVSAGAAILQGLWNGMKSIAAGVLSWISNIGNQIKAGFAAAVHLGSPSKDFDKFGVFIMSGLLNGLNSLAPKVLSRISGIGTATKEAWSKAVSGGALASGLPKLTGPSASTAMPTAGGMSSSNGVTINIHNPTAERGSDSVNRAARVNALLGAF